MAVVIVVVCVVVCVEACNVCVEACNVCGDVSIGVVLWYCGIGMVCP